MLLRISYSSISNSIAITDKYGGTTSSNASVKILEFTIRRSLYLCVEHGNNCVEFNKRFPLLIRLNFNNNT